LIRKRVIPNNKQREPLPGFPEREFIFFKVKFNAFRPVGDSVANEILDAELMEECECVLALPESYTEDGEPTPLILSCHGAGSKVKEADNTIGGIPLVKDCIEAGYAALDVNGSMPHGLTMGCPEHICALYKAYRYAITHFNLSERVLIAGGSMGGHTALNFAHTYPSVTLALGIFYPRLNIDGVDIDGHYCIGTWDKRASKGNNPSTHDRIVEVYRFAEDEWCENTTIGFNPYKTRSFINSEGKRVVIPPCPIKIWQGTEDTVTDPVMAKEYVESVKRSGSYIELHLLEGMGHTYNEVMRRELLYWFNRFI